MPVSYLTGHQHIGIEDDQRSASMDAQHSSVEPQLSGDDRGGLPRRRAGHGVARLEDLAIGVRPPGDQPPGGLAAGPAPGDRARPCQRAAADRAGGLRAGSAGSRVAACSVA